MRSILRATAAIGCIALLASLLAGCGSTRFVSTWKEPTAGPGSLVGQKIATFVLSPQESVRRSAEELLANEISARGAAGVAGYTLLPGEQARDQEKAKQVLQDNDFGYALVLRAVDKEHEERYVPGETWHSPVVYRSWGGYWRYGWTAVHEPGYMTTDTVYTVETLLYSLEDEKLVWAGRSETTNPGDLETFISDYAAAVDDELRKSGLLR